MKRTIENKRSEDEVPLEKKIDLLAQELATVCGFKEDPFDTPLCKIHVNCTKITGNIAQSKRERLHEIFHARCPVSFLCRTQSNSVTWLSVHFVLSYVFVVIPLWKCEHLHDNSPLVQAEDIQPPFGKIEV